MKLSLEHISILENAEAKALATYGPHGINVVPVSTIFVNSETITLVNYFFGKTIENIRNNPSVALVCWKGMEGVQVKGTVECFDSGPEFDRVVLWVAEHIPGRHVRGIVVITPEQIHSVTPHTPDID